MKPKFLLLISSFIATLFAACSPTIPLQVLQPADMVVPEHIQTIVTVDRSKPEKGFLNFLEGLITGEAIAQDREGRRAALNGLTEALSRTPRFTVKHSGIELIGSKGGNSYAAPLEWREVEKICRDYNAQALVTIETYDSDNNISYNTRIEKYKKDGKELTRTKYDARLDMTIRIGWRFYDPKTQVVLDEYMAMDQESDTHTGNTQDEARRYLQSQTSISRTASKAAGLNYGMRIAPVWITVSRAFYDACKGNAAAQMEQAARYAKADQWEKAAEIWQALLKTSVDDKTAGRAAYNLAVANERAGMLESAVEWAQRAYTQYGNKKGQGYIVELKNRISDQARLRQQMKEKV
jgi:tetratricopeptide (TPR) repeat protein